MNWWYKLQRIDLWRTNLWLRFTWFLPAKAIYWCGIRMAAYATTGDYSNKEPDNVSIMDMLKAWEKGHEIQSD